MLDLTAINVPPVRNNKNSLATILVVDDNPEDRTAVRHFLSEAGAEEGLSFRVCESGKGDDGLAAWRSQAPDCILLDYHLPDMDGLEFLDRLRTSSGGMPVPVVVFTGSSDRVLASAALRGGAQEYLPKQFMGPEMLLRAVLSAMDRFNLQVERERAEAALAASEKLLRLSQEAGRIAAFEQDLLTGVIHWAAGSQTLLGFQPSQSTMSIADWRAVWHPDDVSRIDAERVAAEANKTANVSYEFRFNRPDNGSVRRIELHVSVDDTVGQGQPRRAIAAVLDVTERRAAEAALARLNKELEQRVNERTAALVEETRGRLETQTMLHQAQKMEAIGQLTGGIAHDFNNLLQIIIGNLDLAQRRLEREQPLASVEGAANGVWRSMNDARKAADSAAQLIQRLLAFGRRQPLAPTRLEVNPLILGLCGLFRRTLAGTTTVEAVLAEDLWPTFADGHQLEAALLNLFGNARDAMPNGGRITIRTVNVKLDHSDTLLLGDLLPGGYLLLSVTDTGGGIAKHVLERVFEPFFTTKAFGHGTGLGLPMVYGFVKQSGGHIHIDSEVGEGTTVKIYLPHSLGTKRRAFPSIIQTMRPDAPNGETFRVGRETNNGVHCFDGRSKQHGGAERMSRH